MSSIPYTWWLFSTCPAWQNTRLRKWYSIYRHQTWILEQLINYYPYLSCICNLPQCIVDIHTPGIKLLTKMTKFGHWQNFYKVLYLEFDLFHRTALPSVIHFTIQEWKKIKCHLQPALHSRIHWWCPHAHTWWHWPARWRRAWHRRTSCCRTPRGKEIVNRNLWFR